MTGLPGRVLAGLAVVALLTGCDGGGEADPPATTASSGSRPSEVPTSGAPTLGAAACEGIEHDGEKLGVTVPAGFSVATPPEGAGEVAETYDVNLLSLAQRPESGRNLPTAMIAVYGFGRGEREGQNALEAAVLNFTQATGGSSRGKPISATPATVAGVEGSVGGVKDARALDYNAPDAVDSTLRWWVLPTETGEFIVTLATATPELDEQLRAELPSGLKPGGC